MSDKEAPKQIWLQEPNDCDDDDWNEWQDVVTWCADKINDTDIKYVRADRYDALLIVLLMLAAKEE